MGDTALQKYRATFMKHPQHTSVLRARRERHRNVFVLSSLALLACSAGVIDSGVLYVPMWMSLLIGWFVLPLWLLKGRDYAVALKLEYDLQKVWTHDSEWALEQLGAYHATQLAQDQEQRRARRTHGLNVMLSISGFVCSLIGIFIIFEHSYVQDWVVFAQSLSLGMFLSFILLTVKHGAKHVKLSQELKSYYFERKVLRRSADELPQGTLNVGALSISVDENSRRGALSGLDGVSHTVEAECDRSSQITDEVSCE